MWYKSLKDEGVFYTKVTASQFMTHISSTFDVLHAINTYNISVIMQGLWLKANNIPKYTNMREEAQCKSQREACPSPTCSS